jgi:hypothetical protein
MDDPVDTAAVAAHLRATQGLGSIDGLFSAPDYPRRV